MAVSSASVAITAVSSPASSVLSSRSELASSMRRCAALVEPGPQAGELPAGHVDAQRLQLGHHVAVAAGGVGLALERAQLAADLAEQVLQPGQVGLGGLEPALGSSPCGGGTSARRPPPR